MSQSDELYGRCWCRQRRGREPGRESASQQPSVSLHRGVSSSSSQVSGAGRAGRGAAVLPRGCWWSAPTNTGTNTGTRRCRGRRVAFQLCSAQLWSPVMAAGTPGFIEVGENMLVRWEDVGWVFVVEKLLHSIRFRWSYRKVFLVASIVKSLSVCLEISCLVDPDVHLLSSTFTDVATFSNVILPQDQWLLCLTTCINAATDHKLLILKRCLSPKQLPQARLQLYVHIIQQLLFNALLAEQWIWNGFEDYFSKPHIYFKTLLNTLELFWSI